MKSRRRTSAGDGEEGGVPDDGGHRGTILRTGRTRVRWRSSWRFQTVAGRSRTAARRRGVAAVLGCSRERSRRGERLSCEWGGEDKGDTGGLIPREERRRRRQSQHRIDGRGRRQREEEDDRCANLQKNPWVSVKLRQEQNSREKD
jgi:hypothetical protein